MTTIATYFRIAERRGIRIDLDPPTAAYAAEPRKRERVARMFERLRDQAVGGRLHPRYRVSSSNAILTVGPNINGIPWAVFGGDFRVVDAGPAEAYLLATRGGERDFASEILEAGRVSDALVKRLGLTPGDKAARTEAKMALYKLAYGVDVSREMRERFVASLPGLAVPVSRRELTAMRRVILRLVTRMADDAGFRLVGFRHDCVLVECGEGEAADLCARGREHLRAVAAGRG